MVLRDIRLDKEKDRIQDFILENWHSPVVVSRGRVLQSADLPGFVIEEAGGIVGLLTYEVIAGSMQIVTINSLAEGKGLGTQLLMKATEKAVALSLQRVWLITTNDNLNALRFYQKRGFCLVAVHRNSLEQSRQLKPEIPQTGFHGIPLRDEIELEMLLNGENEANRSSVVPGSKNVPAGTDKDITGPSV